MKLLLSIMFALLYLAPLRVLATQETDSLELRVLIENEPAQKIVLLEKLSRTYLYIDTEKAQEFAEKANQISIETDNKAAQISSTLLLSEIYWSKTDYKESMRLALLATDLSEENNKLRSLARSYLIIGTIYLRLDNYNKSLEYYFKSLKIFKEIKDEKYISSTLNNLGSVFSDQKNYEKAIDYFTEALTIAERNNDSAIIELCLSNIASALSASGELEKAKKMILKTIRSQNEDPFNNRLGTNVMNLSIVYSKLNQYDSASILFEKALPIFIQMDDESKKALFYLNYGRFFFEIEDFDKSILNASIAFDKSREYGFPDITLKSAKLLRENYLELNNLDEAFRFSLIELEIKDSLYSERNSAKIFNYELQYHFDQERQEKELTQQRKDFILIIIIVFFISVLAVGVLVFARQREKAKNILLEKQNLKAELDFKNKEFASSVLFLMKKNELLSQISEKLVHIEEKAQNSEIKHAIHYIGKELKKSSEQSLWEEFEIRFKEVHSGFYENLNVLFPDLTANDIRLCAFLKLNLSSKEISEITGQRVATLEAARSRIRKKLGISKTPVDLVTFLSSY